MGFNRKNVHAEVPLLCCMDMHILAGIGNTTLLRAVLGTQARACVVSPQAQKFKKLCICALKTMVPVTFGLAMRGLDDS